MLRRYQVIEDLVKCGYLKSADIADRFGDPSTLNPALDPTIVGPNGHIQPGGVRQRRRNFAKTAAVMKLVVNGLAGAGLHNNGRL